MNTDNLLPLVDGVRRALSHQPTWEVDALAKSLDIDHGHAVFHDALRFLDARHEILIDGVGRTVHGRNTVAQAILSCLATHGPLDQAGLRKHIPLPLSVLADVLGWLERDRRIDTRQGPGGDEYRYRRGLSGSVHIADATADADADAATSG